MNEDTSPIAVPGFLDPSVYGSIYMAVENTINENAAKGKNPYSEPFVDKDPFITYVDNFDQDVYSFIQDAVQECFEHTVSNPEIMFARLNKKPIKSDNPLPRINSTSRINEATLVVILDSTIPWKLYLDGLFSYTERNMGIFFPDTNGVTWDMPEEFSDLDYMDILVCRMSIKD